MFYLLLGIVIFDFVLSRTLSILNAGWESKPVPTELADIYDEEKRKKQLEFNRASRRFSWISNSFDLLVTIAMLFGGYRILDEYIHLWFYFAPVDSPILRDTLMAIIFFLTLSIASSVINIPFSVYRTFVLMQRFGFNRTTPATFIFDWLKSNALNILLTSIILFAVVPIYDTMPDYFWLLAWGVMAAFSLFMTYFYSNLIVPLFNKQTPLPEGELRDAIEKLATSVDFKLDNIYVMDSSKRSTLGNAYFTGFGRRKRIVLYDTLIEQLTTDEILAVLAHEIGHYKGHHTVKGIITSLTTSLVMFVLLGLTLRYNLCAGAVGCVASFHINMYLFYTLYDPIDTIISLASNAISRRHEFEADNFTRKCNLATHQISALKKLSAHALSNPTPHPAFVFFHYSHPALLDRIRNLQQ